MVTLFPVTESSSLETSFRAADEVSYVGKIPNGLFPISFDAWNFDNFTKATWLRGWSGWKAAGKMNGGENDQIQLIGHCNKSGL